MTLQERGTTLNRLTKSGQSSRSIKVCNFIYSASACAAGIKENGKYHNFREVCKVMAMIKWSQ